MKLDTYASITEELPRDIGIKLDALMLESDELTCPECEAVIATSDEIECGQCRECFAALCREDAATALGI